MWQFQNHDALLFDCDGTLADTMPAHYRGWLAVTEPHGIDFDEDLARAHPYTGTRLHLEMQEAPCDYRHGNRFEGGAPSET